MSLSQFSASLIQVLSDKAKNECLIVQQDRRTLYLPVSEYARESLFKLFGRNCPRTERSSDDGIPTALCLEEGKAPFLVWGHFGRIICVRLSEDYPTEQDVLEFLSATYAKELEQFGIKDAGLSRRYVILDNPEPYLIFDLDDDPEDSSDMLKDYLSGGDVDYTTAFNLLMLDSPSDRLKLLRRAGYPGDIVQLFRDVAKKHGSGWSCDIIKNQLTSDRPYSAESTVDMADVIDFMTSQDIDFAVSCLIIGDWLSSGYGNTPNDASEIILTLYSCLAMHVEYFDSAYWPEELIKALDSLDCLRHLEETRKAIKKMDNYSQAVLPFFLACRFARPGWVLEKPQASLQCRYLICDDRDYREHEKPGSHLDVILETPVWQNRPRFRTGNGYHCIPRLTKGGCDVFKLVGEHARRIAASMFLSEEQSAALAGAQPTPQTVTNLVSDDGHKKRALSLMMAIEKRFSHNGQ